MIGHEYGYTPSFWLSFNAYDGGSGQEVPYTDAFGNIIWFFNANASTTTHYLSRPPRTDRVYVHAKPVDRPAPPQLPAALRVELLTCAPEPTNWNDVNGPALAPLNATHLTLTLSTNDQAEYVAFGALLPGPNILSNPPSPMEVCLLTVASLAERDDFAGDHRFSRVRSMDHHRATFLRAPSAPP